MAKEQTKAEILGNIQEMMSKVYDYANSVIEDDETPAHSIDDIANNHNLDLTESIRRIVSSDAKSNHRLMESLDKYAGAIRQGVYDECIYESFLKNLSQYTYLTSVEKEYERINDAANENIVSITVAKLLERMSNCESYYIVPMIEEDAVRYAKNPSVVNRTQLYNALCPFAQDPYCMSLLEFIETDGDIAIKRVDEKAMTIKDQIKMIRANASVNAIYSPVQYIKENESVFNVHGQFYVKKGNNIAKLNNMYLDQLSENFISLCKLVNDKSVEISEECITLYGKDKIAHIYENYAEINGEREDAETLRNLPHMGMKYDYDTNFFVMASCLLENFDNIANIDFAKRIEVNGDDTVYTDVFRLGENIYINTVNENVDKSTFYSNVNPIQCRNIINRHMNMNVANLFEDLLPKQDSIMLKLNETKNEYEATIEKYEATIQKLKDAKV